MKERDIEYTSGAVDVMRSFGLCRTKMNRNNISIITGHYGLRLSGFLLLAVIFLGACSERQSLAQRPQLLPTMAANMDYATRFAPAVMPTSTAFVEPTGEPTASATAVAVVQTVKQASVTATAVPPPKATATQAPTATQAAAVTLTPAAAPTLPHPLNIELMRQDDYPGSPLTIERELSSGSNYRRYIASYESEGSRIFAYLTVPKEEIPTNGWPVIIFNHGYIPPENYRTTRFYMDHVNNLARNGYVVFKSDYRGHGDSEGQPSGAYGSPGYTIDVLNGLAAVKNLPGVDSERIGMWGHSMGGYITLRAMVVSDEIKTGVIWGGVVASYKDLLDTWGRRAGEGPTPTPDPNSGGSRPNMLEIYGTPEENPEFWSSISSNSFLNYLSGPLQLHHSTTDEIVPVDFSKKLFVQSIFTGQPAELFLYRGDNHNIAANFGTAMRRSIDYFDRYLKDGD